MGDPLDRFVPSTAGYARPLLDRLMDAEPDRSEDPPQRPVDQMRQLREGIRRDLEALLNTRRRPVSTPQDLPDLEDALVSYGIDGFVAANLATEAAKLRFARAVERRISKFETRLSDVSVSILKRSDERDRALRMRITASFRLHEGMPPIRLESMVDPSTHRIEIEAPNG